MVVGMRGSVFLAVLALPVAGCSVLLDWSEYSGGPSDAASVDVANVADSSSPNDVTDAAVAMDVTTMTDPHDVQASEDVGAEAEAGQPEAAGPTCNIATCPTQSCDITVYFRACCLPDGGCGCQSTIPEPGTCM
jgi:hypothetical protein